MPFFGQPETEPARVNRLKHEAEHRQNREQEALKEAARDPYRKMISKGIGGRPKRSLESSPGRSLED